jgi:hypothetical protein
MICNWCGRGRLIKHPDPTKAKEGISLCDGCGKAHSSKALVKGSYAFLKNDRIVTGIRPMQSTRFVNGRRV